MTAPSVIFTEVHDMKKVEMKYGEEMVEFLIPSKNILGSISSTYISSGDSEEDIIIEALENPINSLKLEELVNKGEKVCIVISDVTRLWQKMWMFLPYIVDKLCEAGVKDEDICFLCATGSHRKQSKDEHDSLLGDKLKDRFKVIDHNSFDKDNLMDIGITSYGTPLSISKTAMEADHIILTGAVVYHDLAGWGGGRKSILPGIAGYESIMTNHGLALGDEVGSGSNPNIGCGKAKNNPIHLDMIEAARMVDPTFLFNVIIGSDGRIVNAVAGDYIDAHSIGMEIVEDLDSVEIEKKADLVIGSLGGYPKDINLYQATKGLSNCKEAVKDGGYIILLCQCQEDYGSNDLKDILLDFENNYDREISLRDKFTVAKYIGFDTALSAEKYNIILVSDLNKKELASSGIKVVDTVEEALSIVENNIGEDYEVYLMPSSGSTLPLVL